MSFNNEYKKLVDQVLMEGSKQECRNGKQYIIPHYSFTITDMQNGWELQLRKMYYRGVLGEFKTLIDPKSLTNVKQFEANGCNYWSKWTGPNGELVLDYHDQLHPQLEDIIEQIKTDPYSRRHVISLWNHENIKSGKLSLPCCWHNLTFSVIEDTLSMVWAQRSVDTMLGLPSDVFLAHLFMQHVANATNLHIGSCLFSLANVHIYEEHMTNAWKILSRTKADYDKPLKFELKE